jgi:glycosyltransferase involved in cell wall biosynthesis
MKILFIHQNFPGQFKYLAPELVKQGHQIKALRIDGQDIPGIESIPYRPQRGTSKEIHPWLSDFETKVIRGEAAAQAMSKLKASGFNPDLIIAHPGWGETLFVKDVFPASKLLNFIEFHYKYEGADTGFDPEFPTHSGYEESARLRMKNINNLLNLEEMDVGLCPTYWQRSTVPEKYQNKINVIFDGIDTDIVKPNSEAKVQIINAQKEKIELKHGDEILTFINRNLEPYRGYHSFMRALPEIQKNRPELKTIIIGGDDVSYGAKPTNGQKWKDIFLNEVKDKLDLSRIYFLGRIPYNLYLNVLQISRCHLYLTYPFVLSWSCIEAMSTGATIIGSKTAPVQEAIDHQKNGLLVDFFNIKEIAQTAIEVLSHPEKYKHLGLAARETVLNKYDLNQVCLPQQIKLINQLLHANA